MPLQFSTLDDKFSGHHVVRSILPVRVALGKKNCSKSAQRFFPLAFVTHVCCLPAISNGIHSFKLRGRVVGTVRYNFERPGHNQNSYEQHANKNRRMGHNGPLKSCLAKTLEKLAARKHDHRTI